MDNDDIRIRNGRALCNEILEPILARFGPISISYGLISPQHSRDTVTYMDPNEPSHHRWDKGAAADIIVHKWVQGLPNIPSMAQLFANENTRTSPALLAHELHDMNLPFSRLISYSESPYLCIAASAEEIANGKPRKAFYENMYEGVPKRKPRYTQMASDAAKAKRFEELQVDGLEHPWQGEGYPTHHGGGRRKLQHIRVSKYTMALDWMREYENLNSIPTIPKLSQDCVADRFAVAGMLYDLIVDRLGVKRLSVITGYTEAWEKANDSNALGIRLVGTGLPSTSSEDIMGWEDGDSGGLGATYIPISNDQALLSISVSSIGNFLASDRWGDAGGA